MKEFRGREEHQERGSVGVWQGGVEGMVLIGLPWVRGGGGDRASRKFREGPQGLVSTHTPEESVGLRWRGDDMEKWVNL